MKILIVVMMMVAVGCMQPTDESTTISALNPAPPDGYTVCGLPTQCNPASCSVSADGTQLLCNDNPAADAICSLACGFDVNAVCPHEGEGGCFEQCGSIIDLRTRLNCAANCMNNLSVTCQTQGEPQ